jgi:F0F1-type ATP synthase epsilon subunit
MAHDTDIAATLAAALAGLDEQAAAAEEKRTAAEGEWQVRSAEITNLQKERCAILSDVAQWGGDGDASRRADLELSIQEVRNVRQSAADTRKEQSELLSLLSLTRHHLVQARRLWAQVTTRLVAPE